jgi:hypothetical protein
MKKLLSLFLFSFVLLSFITAQSSANNIPISKIPADVKAVLEQYVTILRSSADLEECAEKFLEVAGGALVNENASGLRQDVPQFSLKKDFNNVKFYANPIKITRVNVSSSNGDGYGWSAIKGKKYKIWIEKANKSNGMPAPITILVPEGHESIILPKVVNIGSL